MIWKRTPIQHLYDIHYRKLTKDIPYLTLWDNSRPMESVVSTYTTDSRGTIYIYIHIDIYIVRYCLWTHERYPYLTLRSEPWVSFVSYLEKSDREISGVHCILEAFGCISLYMNQCSDVWSNRWNRNSELRNFSRYTILRCKNDMFLPWLLHRSGQVIESYAMGSKSNASWHKILFRHALIIFLVLLTCLTCINKKPWPT